MSTNGDSETTISHLFSNEAPAAAPVTATEQPLPPDVADSYSHQPGNAAPEAAPAAQEPAQQPQQQHMVPLAELIDTRKRAQAAEAAAAATQRDIAQLREMMARQSQPQPQAQPPQPVIDPVEDPQGFVQAVTATIERRFLDQSLNDSERRARKDFGEAAVDAAFEAARNSGFAQSFIHRPDAYREMVEWHQGEQLRKTIGSDPTAYTEQLKAQIKAQLLAEMRQGTPPPSNLTQPLSSATRLNGAVAPEVLGSDKDFFKQTMNPQRRG